MGANINENVAGNVPEVLLKAFHDCGTLRP